MVWDQHEKVLLQNKLKQYSTLAKKVASDDQQVQKVQGKKSTENKSAFLELHAGTGMLSHITSKSAAVLEPHDLFDDKQGGQVLSGSKHNDVEQHIWESGAGGFSSCRSYASYGVSKATMNVNPIRQQRIYVRRVSP